ncbi:MAG: DUF86 domain-containing protein [Candidatus Bipolaricaulota bacterium]|nr:DUF86 domain-containing protein [Candidatus Bipolaricaulota bacterium]
MAELDRERILIKADRLDGYLRELADIAPRTFAEYQGVEKKRACERLLQLSVEVVIDICSVLVTNLRLGLPAEEEDLIHKLTEGRVLSPEMGARIREMKGFRNVLVHEYAQIDDRLVYQALTERVKDFVAFKQEVLAYLKR